MCMHLHVLCVCCLSGVMYACVPGMCVCAPMCMTPCLHAFTGDHSAVFSGPLGLRQVARCVQGGWTPAIFWVSEGPGSEPEAPPSPVSPVWVAELPGPPHHGLPASPGGPRLTLVHHLVGTRVPGSPGVLKVGSDLAPARLQWERQAGGSLPSGVPCPVHGTAVLPAWELGTSETPRLVEACPRESSPRRWPAGLAAKERGAGSGWSCGRGASRLRPAGPPLQQSRRRPWRPRELPPREAGRAGSRTSLLPAPAPRGCPGCERRAPCQRLMAETSGEGRLGAEAGRVDCGQRSVGGTRARVEWVAQAFQWGPWARGGRALRGGGP